MIQNLEMESHRIYFGICKCCGCKYGIENLEENMIIYRCFNDRRIKDKCRHFKEHEHYHNIEFDKNGRCIVDDCPLNHLKDDDAVDETSYIVNMISKFDKFFLLFTNPSKTIFSIMDKLKNDYVFQIKNFSNKQIYCIILHRIE